MSVQDRPLRRGWTTGTCAAAAAKAAYAALLTGEFPDPVVGKMTKLAQGPLDLHSKRGAVDLAALAALAAAGIALEVAVFDRDGGLVGRAPFAPAHERSPPRNRRR